MATPSLPPSNIAGALLKVMGPQAKAAQAQSRQMGDGVTATPQPDGTTKLDIPMATGARYFHLQATPENMQAFVAWLHAFDRPGNLGPTEFKPSANVSVKRDHPSDPARVRLLQTALARRGYAVQPTGTWDQPTSSAVVQFKHARGVHEQFRTVDGKWAITPFADEALTAQILGQ